MSWNPSDKGTGITLSSGNAVETSSNGSTQTAVRSDTSHSSGKFYVEFTALANGGSTNYFVGFGEASASLSSANAGGSLVVAYSGGGSGFLGILGSFFFGGNMANLKDPGTSGGATRVGMAIDFGTGNVWVRTDGGNWNGDATANPATATGGKNGSGIVGLSLFPMAANGATGATVTLNDGNTTFIDAAPSGFSPWKATAVTGGITTALTKASQSAVAKEIFTGTVTTALSKASQAVHAVTANFVGNIRTALTKLTQSGTGEISGHATQNVALNPIYNANGTLTNGNLTWTHASSSSFGFSVATRALDLTVAQKLYFEITINALSTSADFGIGTVGTGETLGQTNAGAQWFPGSSNDIFLNGSNAGSAGVTATAGHTYGFLYDMTTQTLQINDVTVGHTATGTARTGFASSGDMVPAVTDDSASTPAQVTFNFGATSFIGSLPSGYLAYDNGSTILNPPGGNGGAAGGITIWNAYTALAPTTISTDGLTASNGPTVVGNFGAASTSSRPTSAGGKWYIEFTNTTFNGSDGAIGLQNTSTPSANAPPVAMLPGEIQSDGQIYAAGVAVPGNGNLTDVYSFAIDFSAGLWWIGYNNTFYGPSSGGVPVLGNPATGSNGIVFSDTGDMFWEVWLASNSTSCTIHASATNQKYAAPAGFSAWDAPSTPSGVWVSIEGHDVMAATGFPGLFGIQGDLFSTENADIFAALGHQPVVGTLVTTEEPDVFSAFGKQPLTGRLVTTENPDIFAATGIGLGENGVFITTEGVDIFAAIGHSPVSGQFVTTEAPDTFSAIGAGVIQVRKRRLVFVT